MERVAPVAGGPTAAAAIEHMAARRAAADGNSLDIGFIVTKPANGSPNCEGPGSMENAAEHDPAGG
jgi:hypothetical protein